MTEIISFIVLAINTLTAPQFFLTPLFFFFLFAIFKPEFWSKKSGLIFFSFFIILFAISLFNTNFRTTISKADNIPIVALFFLVSFFIWLGMKQAHENDKRISENQEIEERIFKEKIMTWPDLVYIEFICLILMIILLIFWSLSVDAPIEEWANPTRSPNPSKAPWYFSGLQEILVYFDPWIAGVLIPSCIIGGLMAIPYIDRTTEGSGYYSFKKRRFGISIFLGGFFFWVMLILIGTFLRGPNWNYYGPFEYWDENKKNLMVSVQLSDIFWGKWLNIKKPDFWLFREVAGISLLLFYFLILPILTIVSSNYSSPAEKIPICGKYLPPIFNAFKTYYESKGVLRYMTTSFLLLGMAGVIIKMYLEWAFNIKYLVAIPEFFLNI